MKQWLPLGVILLAAVLAIAASEWQKIDARPSVQGVLSLGADVQREMTRVPARLDRLSDEDEIRIGGELAQVYSERWHSVHGEEAADLQTTQYIQTVGLRVAYKARRKLPYKFHYIPDPQFVNAFALPDGQVFIGQGLLALMKSEDALAAVLGHEVEHIDLRHCAERVQVEAHLRNLGALGSLVGLPVEVFVAGYSKEQESEADANGTALAVAAGYSPLGILQLFGEFETLEREAGAGPGRKPASPIEEAAQLSLGTLQGYFESHPPAASREQQIRTLLRSERWPTPALRPLLVPKKMSATSSRTRGSQCEQPWQHGVKVNPGARIARYMHRAPESTNYRPRGRPFSLRAGSGERSWSEERRWLRPVPVHFACSQRRCGEASTKATSSNGPL